MQILKPHWIASEDRPIFALDIHPDGTRFATGGIGADSATGRVAIWNMQPLLSTKASTDDNVPKLLAMMEHHLGCVNCIRWSGSGTFLASGGDDKLVMIWKKSAYGGGAIFGGGGKVNIESWRCVHTLRGHSGDVLDLAWSPNDALLATASVDNTVIVWNGERLPEIVATLRAHTGLVKGVVFDPVGKYLASQSDDRSLRVWRTSDWREEAAVTAPFEECGATTHVLRPGWSPDGSMLVSAHAMNGGGPTAQIIERSTWSTTRDFVGHKKAISCVRFNRNLMSKKDSSDVFVSVALGSRDRSFSIWSTDLKRPLIVINDVFDQSVLDLSWRKDGKVLLACSMDGTVAAVILGREENGCPLSETKTYDLLSKSYGKSFGRPPTVTKKTNGTVILENPELLKIKRDTAKTNGAEEEAKLKPKPSGPTDRQIESRTTDGRRRITPIFIPPDAEESRGADDFGSSSSHEKSKIEVQKMDKIVKPNVSPNKKKDDGDDGDGDGDGDTAKKKKGKEDEDDEIPVNVIKARKAPKEPEASLIAVKKKPGPTGGGSGNNSSTNNNNNSGSGNSSPKARNLKKSGVISDSSSSSSGSDSSSSSDEDSSDESDDGENKKDKKGDKMTNGTGGGSSSAAEDKLTAKKKEMTANRPGLFSKATKRKLPTSAGPAATGATASAADDASEIRPKKRGRPAGALNREEASSAAPPMPPPAQNATQAFSDHRLQDPDRFTAAADAAPTTASGAALGRRLCPSALPTLTMERGKTAAFTIGEEKLAVAVHNNYKTFNRRSVHLIKCQSSEKGRGNWHTLLSGEVGAVRASSRYLLVACKDATFNVFTPAGQRRFPPIMLPAPLSKIDVDGDTVAAVTDTARFFLWEILESGLKAVMRNECVASLLWSSRDDENVTVEKVGFSESKKPVIVTSAGKAYIYSDEVGAWLKMTDQGDSIMAISSYAGTNSRRRDAATAEASKSKFAPASSTALPPLASLSRLAAPSLAPLHDVPSNFRSMADLAHCEAQRISAEYLKSGREYKFWLLAAVKHHARAGNADKLREILNDLMGTKEEGWSPTVLGEDKRAMLREALQLVASNVELQRLFAEFNDLLDANTDDLMDVQGALE